MQRREIPTAFLQRLGDPGYKLRGYAPVTLGVPANTYRYYVR